MTDNVKNLGWRVTFAGTGINLALGILYTWSVISKAIPKEWGWTEAQRSLPYSIACIVFALVMVPAGRMQDKIGPKWVALAGGVCTGLGLIIASLSGSSLTGFILGFGVLAGSGIGMGYASATPPAVKWFPPQKTGLIAGLVVAGFGLASVYISPLAKWMIASFGVSKSMMIFGVAFLIIVSALSQLLENPPAGYKPVAVAAANTTAKASAPAVAVNYSAGEMLKTPQFYLLWVMYVFAAGAGLMIIGKLAKIVDVQGGIKAGFAFVAILAIGNAGGRIIAGIMSDKIGRTTTMLIVFLFQAILMFILRFVAGSGLFVLLSLLLGFNYGANLSLFPSATKDYFGLKNFGMNYGLVFTAWGVGGFVLPLISGKVYDAALAVNKAAAIASGGDPAKALGNFNKAYIIAGACLLIAAALSFLVKPPSAKTA